MAVGTFIPEGIAPRNTLVVAVKIPNATSYIVLGYRSPDGELTVNTESTTEQDILGNTFTDVTNVTMAHPFSSPLNSADYVFQGWVNDVRRRKAWNELKVDALLIEAYEGSEGAYTATRYAESSVLITSLGGAAADNRVNLGYTINFEGTTTIGTVNTAKRGEEITFTPATEESPLG